MTRNLVNGIDNPPLQASRFTNPWAPGSGITLWIGR